MEVIAIHSGARCAICQGPIKKGDHILKWEDRHIHGDCEPSFESWDSENVLPPELLRLKLLLDERRLLSERFIEAGLDINQLPKSFDDAAVQVMVAEGALFSLLRDVVEEHREA